MVRVVRTDARKGVAVSEWKKEWLAYLSLVTLSVGFGVLLGVTFGVNHAEHNIAKKYYARCRENLGLFEPMTTLQKGESACAHLITEELGIENHWKDELR